MEISRRKFVVGSVSMFALGCTHTKRPSTMHPIYNPPRWTSTDAHGSGTINPGGSPTSQPQPPILEPGAIGPLHAIARWRWAGGQPIPNRLNPMGFVSRITIHHEGWTPVWFTDAPTTAKRLESIRRSHLQRMNAGDIGYHFIIDRAGSLWEGRQISYQGAHVRKHNPHNIGLMLLGNFELQRPTDPQIASLKDTLTKLMRHHRVPTSQVYTHRELNVTTCPGKSLQAQMIALRRNGHLLG